MLKQLSLTNFQSHKDTSLDFSTGVNIIVGASDSGKTALIRALRWLITNKPSGDQFRSYWGGKTEAELFTDSAHVVRSRDKENEYVLGDTHFKAFSTEVPKEISDALNFSDLNLQGQLDQPFLLSLSPGETASFFNKIANLDAIDRGTSNVNSAIRELTADIKYKEAEGVKLLSDIDTYKHIPLFEYDVEILEKQEKELNILNASFEKLYQLTAGYAVLEDKMNYFQETLSMEKPVNDLLDLYQKRAEKDASAIKLMSLIIHVKQIQFKTDKQKSLLESEQPVLELLELIKGRDLLAERQKRLSFALSSVRSIQVRITNGMSYVKEKQVLFEKEMGDECPLCNQKIIHGKNS